MTGDVVISVENISKSYRLGQLGTGTLVRDLQRWMDRILRRPDSHDHVGMNAERRIGIDGRDICALRNVSFRVQRGEVLGIIGRNGSGKSTLLKIMSRVTAPTRGYVKVKGRIASLLEVGTGFHPELTGEENIFLNGAILGMTTAETKAKLDDIVAFSGIGPYLHTPVKRYSSGMYVRLAFAVAAHLESDILLVDEVLAVGDADFQNKCLGKLQGVARGGRTVLLVSHSMETVRRLCTRVIWLDDGRIRTDSADTGRVIHHYLSHTLSIAGHTSWVADRNFSPSALLHPKRMSLISDDGELLQLPVSNTMPINILIEAFSSHIDEITHLGIVVSSEDGTVVFQSFYGDTHPATWPQLSSGHFAITMRIPPRFLNAGRYIVELAAGTQLEWIYKPGFGNPSVTLEILGGLSDSPRWRGRRPGLVAPVFQWRSLSSGSGHMTQKNANMMPLRTNRDEKKHRL